MFNVTGRVEIRGIDITGAYQGTHKLDENFVSDTKATIPTEDGKGRWEVEIINPNGQGTVARIMYFQGGDSREFVRYREVLPLQEDGTLFLGSISETRWATFFRSAELGGLSEGYFQEFGQKVDVSAAEFGPDTLTKIHQKAEERDFQQRLNAMGITRTCGEIFGEYEGDWHILESDLKSYMIVVSHAKIDIEDEDQDLYSRKIHYNVSSNARWVIVAEYVDNGVCIMREVHLEVNKMTPWIIEDLERFLAKHKMRTFFDLLDNGYALVPADDYGRPRPAKDDESG